MGNNTKRFSNNLFENTASNIWGRIAFVWIIIRELILDRLFGWINTMIDNWLGFHPRWINNISIWLLKDAFHLSSGIAVSVILIIFIDAWRKTIKTKNTIDVDIDVDSELININLSNSANTMCKLAENFMDDFEFISKDENSLALRQKKAHESFLQLITFFEQTKLQFDCWKEIQKNLRKITAIFDNYSDLLKIYLEYDALIKETYPNSPKYDLLSLKDQIFGDSASKTIEKTNTFIQSIIDMLRNEKIYELSNIELISPKLEFSIRKLDKAIKNGYMYANIFVKNKENFDINEFSAGITGFESILLQNSTKEIFVGKRRRIIGLESREWENKLDYVNPDRQPIEPGEITLKNNGREKGFNVAKFKNIEEGIIILNQDANKHVYGNKYKITITFWGKYKEKPINPIIKLYLLELFIYEKSGMALIDFKEYSKKDSILGT